MAAKRRKLNITDLGTSTEIGSSEWDYEIGYMTGDDQSVDDPVSINTITTFYNQKIAFKAPASSFKYLVETSAIAADRTVTFPLLTGNGKFVIDTFGNLFTVAQLFDAAIKAKPITTPSTDASYGQFFCHSADANKPKFVKPDGTLLDLSAGGTVTDIPQNLTLSGDISPTQITANQNDYNPSGLSTALTLRLTTDASRNITGLAGGADGRIIIIHNVGSFNIVLQNQNASSIAANRFITNADLTLTPDKTALFRYDSTTSRWRLISTSVDASGGGSGAITILAKTTTNVSITNTTTETSMFSASVPANTLTNHGVIRVSCRLEYTNNSGGTASIIPTIKYGTTTLFSDSIGTMSASVDKRVVYLNFEIYPDNNSASAQMMEGYINVTEPGGAATGFGDPNDDEIMGHSAIAGNSSETTGTSKTLDVRFAHSTASANITLTLKMGMMEVIA